MSIPYELSIESAVRAMKASDEDGQEHLERVRERRDGPIKRIRDPQTGPSRRHRTRSDQIVRDWRERPRAQQGRPGRPVMTDRGESFPSITDAAYSFGVSNTAVNCSINCGSKCAGRVWRHASEMKSRD